MVLSMTRKVTMDDEVVAQVFRQPSRSSFSSVSNNFQFLGLDLRKCKRVWGVRDRFFIWVLRKLRRWVWLEVGERVRGFAPIVGKVKQIVGSTLSDSKEDGSTLVSNFVSDKSATKNAKMYDEDGLTGGHAIMLGADSLSKAAAIEAMHAYPDGSMYVFNNEQMDLERLKDLVSVVGKDRLVLNLSCIKREGKYAIVIDRWQKFIDVYLDEEILDFLANYVDEFLVYGVDVEGQKYYVKSHVRINI
ncbi:unnamed protein product [Prunus armeniaca]|uniref:Uncharacterized protein n=1 Tax=Prunus armeniaca TaxID=36596 RepID=A0A6J5TK61_PRUAR|nr:unnamed protein product [Prunus armeniaca]